MPTVRVDAGRSESETCMEGSVRRLCGKQIAIWPDLFGPGLEICG
jgi:hypothetical protein